MFIKDVLALPDWFLFVELFVYAGIILFGIIPAFVSLIKRRQSVNSESPFISRAQADAERIMQQVSRQYLNANEKRRQTVKEKYGVDYAFQYTSNEKRRQTMLKKYGVEYAFQLNNES